MPFCPQCGAEYIEGITRCRKCDRELVEERPEHLPAPERELPPFLQSLVSRCVQAFRYLRDAFWFLYRHPSLLWLPVLLAVFNVVELYVGQYYAFAHTPWGKKLIAEHSKGVAFTMPDEYRLPFTERLQLAIPPVTRTAFRDTSDLLSASSYAPHFKGTTQVISAYSSSATTKDLFRIPTAGIVAGILAYFIGIFFGAIITAGYYSVIYHAIGEGTVRWSAFWPGVRRYALRIFWYYLFLTLVLLPSFIVLITPVKFSDIFAHLSYYWWILIEPLYALTFAIIPVAIIVGDVRFRSALVHSLKMMWGRLPISLLLVLGTMLFCITILLPFQLRADAMTMGINVHALFPIDLLKQIPLDALIHILLTLVGVWAILMMFLWYRDTYLAPPALVIEESSDTTTPEA